MAFDHRGVLWIQTDVSTSTLNMKEYAGMGNNQMVDTIPGTNEYRRFLTAPNGSEVTGIAFTPDNKTLFINIQHRANQPKVRLIRPIRKRYHHGRKAFVAAVRVRRQW
ncbi:alkaline phosphatase PhoX [Neisseria weixii]|uniref:alkaline phosphatase PhoX n=1 Tax=Neisseria weixii TaxID=1853276 RepID=UPI003B8A7420